MVINTCPARTWSPDFTRIFVSEPSTCGWILAERRDLIVATYSSVRGTAARLMTSVFTGMACGAGCFASVLLHPEVTSTRNSISREKVNRANRFILGTSVVAVFLKMLAKRSGIQNGYWIIVKGRWAPQLARGESGNASVPHCHKKVSRVAVGIRPQLAPG